MNLFLRAMVRPGMAWASRFAAVGGLLLVAACQNNGSMSMTPQPGFNGPAMITAPAPLSQKPVVAVKPPVRTVIPNRGNSASLPAGWVPPVAVRPWRYIVIHHSATLTGGAAAFDRMHRDKGWDELGYHWVVGNGTETSNGQIEVGPRWLKQKWGAHTKTPDNRFNDYGIGVCLVGNFDITRPTSEQVKSLSKLVAYLMRTYHISADHVLGHGDCKPTDCPGRNMSVASIRRNASQILAASGVDPDFTKTAWAEGMTLPLGMQP